MDIINQLRENYAAENVQHQHKAEELNQRLLSAEMEISRLRSEAKRTADLLISTKLDLHKVTTSLKAIREEKNKLKKQVKR